MSIKTEITRLEQAKAGLKASIEGKGVTVPEGTKLDAYPAFIDSISSGEDSSDVPDGINLTIYSQYEMTLLLPIDGSYSASSIGYDSEETFDYLNKDKEVVFCIDDVIRSVTCGDNSSVLTWDSWRMNDDGMRTIGAFSINEFYRKGHGRLDFYP